MGDLCCCGIAIWVGVLIYVRKATESTIGDTCGGDMVSTVLLIQWWAGVLICQGCDWLWSRCIDDIWWLIMELRYA